MSDIFEGVDELLKFHLKWLKTVKQSKLFSKRFYSYKIYNNPHIIWMMYGGFHINLHLKALLRITVWCFIGNYVKWLFSTNIFQNLLHVISIHEFFILKKYCDGKAFALITGMKKIIISCILELQRSSKNKQFYNYFISWHLITFRVGQHKLQFYCNIFFDIFRNPFGLHNATTSNFYIVLVFYKNATVILSTFLSIHRTFCNCKIF